MQIPIPTDVSLQQLLELLETEETEDDSSFRTRAEWQELTGLGQGKMYRVLHAANKRGILRRRKVFRTSLTGDSQRRMAYAIVRSTQAEEEEDDGQE